MISDIRVNEYNPMNKLPKLLYTIIYNDLISLTRYECAAECAIKDQCVCVDMVCECLSVCVEHCECLELWIWHWMYEFVVLYGEVGI